MEFYYVDILSVDILSVDILSVDILSRRHFVGAPHHSGLSVYLSILGLWTVPLRCHEDVPKRPLIG